MSNVAFAAIFYATFQTLAGYAAQKLSDIWFLVLGTVSIVTFTIIIVSYQLFTGNSMGKITPTGAILIFLANGGITMFSLFLGRSFQQLDPKLVTPLVFGGALFISTIVGFVLSKTVPSIAQIVSLGLICGGLVMLGLQGK